MKSVKIIGLTLLTALIVLIGYIGAFCAPIILERPSYMVGASNLYALQYTDYANDVVFDEETYPELENQGLYWLKEESNGVAEIKADTEEGADLIDTSKPTIINVHGVLLNDGHQGKERYLLSNSLAKPNDYEQADRDVVNMNIIYLRKGYNVGNYHYNNFADESEILMAPTFIESKIWGLNGKQGSRYRKSDGTYSSTNTLKYSLAEHFLADYLRAINLLDSTMGNAGIQIAGHSMGGQLSIAFTFLTTEMVRVGQLRANAMPNRLTLLDPYLGSPSIPFMRVDGLGIRWSGADVVNNTTGDTILECLKAIDYNDIGIEYYTETGSFLKMASSIHQKEVSKYVMYQTMKMQYGNGFNPLKDAHNAVRSWYLCSLITERVASGFSAKSTLAEIKAAKGKNIIQTEGSFTFSTKDDVFEIQKEEEK